MILIHLTPYSLTSVADKGVCSCGVVAFKNTFGWSSELVTKSLAIWVGALLGSHLGSKLAGVRLLKFLQANEEHIGDLSQFTFHRYFCYYFDAAVWHPIVVVAGAITGSKFDTFLRIWYKEVMDDNVEKRT